MIKSWRQRLLAAGFVPLIGSLAAPAEADEARQRSGTDVGKTVRQPATTKDRPGDVVEQVGAIACPPACAGQQPATTTVKPGDAGEEAGAMAVSDKLVEQPAELKARPGDVVEEIKWTYDGGPIQQPEETKPKQIGPAGSRTVPRAPTPKGR